MSVMAKTPKRGPGRPRKRENPKTIHADIDAGVGNALSAYLKSLDYEPVMASVVEHALREFLEKRGFWPHDDEE